MDTSAKSDVEEQATDREPGRRRIRTLEEKLRILEEAAEPGASVAAVARKYDLNANLLFGWRRLHRRGLLEAQRHAPPLLLPVTITSPTITPTRRTRTTSGSKTPSASQRRSVILETFVEVVLADEFRIRLHGEAQHALLERVLDWLPRR